MSEDPVASEADHDSGDVLSAGGDRTPLHYAGIALAVVTGVVHLVLGVGNLTSPFGVAFVVAAAGFFGGAAMVWVDYRRRLVYLLGIPFTLGQVVLYFVLNPDPVAPLGLLDKAVQVAFVAVLVVLYRREE
jgi:hypothetical protein